MANQARASEAETYLPKTEAAAALGLSERRLGEYAQRGKIERRYVFDEKTKRKAVMFRHSDIARLRLELQAGPEAAAVMLGPRAQEQAAPVDHGGGLAQFMAARMLPAPALVIERAWLTFEEAEALSGLPARYLRWLVKIGELPARNIGGREPGGPWRIHREALNALGSQSKQ